MYRAGSGLGLFRSLFVAGLIAFLLLALFTYFSNAEWSRWITGGYLLAILSLQIKRRDKRFLKINVANYHSILFMEYVFASLPLLFCQLYFGFFDLVIITVAVLILIPFMGFTFQRKGLNNRLIRAIPDEAFEWKSGVRKYFIFIFTIWLVGIGTSWYVGSVPVVMVILALAIFNFYETGEPLSILLSLEASPRQFLYRKLLTAQTILSFSLLPLIMAFVLFHHELWYIPVVEFVVISFILWYAILLKYAFYKPNKQLIAGQVFTAIGAMSLFLPFLIPLTWILSVRFYFKSITNLKPYLDDFN